MARTLAQLPKGSRISDYISLGVIAKTFPPRKIQAVLRATGKAGKRQRDLPAQVVVYYVIALSLYMQSSYRKCCGACWKGCSGWPSREGSCEWRATRGSPRRGRGWEPRRCGNSMMRWSSPSRGRTARAPGIGNGVW